MLVLTASKDGKFNLLLDGKPLGSVKVVKIDTKKVRIGFELPDSVTVLRDGVEFTERGCAGK